MPTLPTPNKSPGDGAPADDMNLVIEAINTLQSQVDNIPAGPQGPQGEPGTPGANGAAATVTVSSTVTTAPGTDAQVIQGGTDQNRTLAFYIPRGATGDITPAAQAAKDAAEAAADAAALSESNAASSEHLLPCLRLMLTLIVSRLRRLLRLRRCRSLMRRLLLRVRRCRLRLLRCRLRRRRLLSGMCRAVSLSLLMLPAVTRRSACCRRLCGGSTLSRRQRTRRLLRTLAGAGLR